eukprot:scaffold33394_cov62-Attheya_sp.AAC.5
MDLDSGEHMQGPPSKVVVPPGQEPHVPTPPVFDDSQSEEKVVDNTVLNEEEAISMLQKGILCRGTVLTSRRFTPTSIRFTDKDAKKCPRGSFRMAAAVKEQHMSIFGWNDGCGVHMISTADGTEIGTVTRQIKAVSKVISAPKVVKRYNDGMQWVDHHDQLRTLFSLAT